MADMATAGARPILRPADLAAWGGGSWDPCPPAAVAGVGTDTRALEPGALFFALQGPNFDGHAFVEAAFRRGAAGAVVNRAAPLPASAARPLLRVDHAERALRAMAAAYRRQVNPLVIGVTGSAGKSTVKEMAAALLASAMPTARTLGNWNNHIGLPLSLLAMAPDCRAGVFEAGTNHPGEIDALCDVLQPDWGIVSNVGPVHVEFFGSERGVAEEKARLLRRLPPGGTAFLNADGGWLDVLRPAAPARVVTVTLRGEADYVCRSRDAGRATAVVAETATGHECEIGPLPPGAHNVSNALLALAAARAAGLPWEAIAPAFAGFRPLPMRWERRTVRGATLINDAYNANPLGMRAALAAFAEEAVPGRRWLVLAGMRELGEIERQEHAALGSQVAAQKVDGLLAVGPLGARIADAAEAAGLPRERVFRCADNVEAAARLCEGLRAGDAVLLKGSRGMRLEEVVRTVEQREVAP